MSYFKYIVLFHDISAFVISLLLIFLSIKTYYKKFYGSKVLLISPLIAVYFVYIFLVGLTLLIYSCYSITLWRPNIILYNAQIIYILGMLWSCVLTANNILDIFLCIDRILLILFPFKYTFKRKIVFLYFTLGCLIVILIVSCWISEILEAFPIDSSTNCLTFGCLIPLDSGFTTLIFRVVIVFTNLFVCGILIVLFKYYVSNIFNSASKSITKTLIFVSIITTISYLIPILITMIGNKVFDVYISSYIGPYNITLYCISIAVCANMYSKVIFKNSNESVIQLQTPVVIQI